MTEQASSGSAPASAPSAPAQGQNAPAGVQPGAHTQAPARGRVSDFESAMEARNQRVNERRNQAIIEHQERSTQHQEANVAPPRDRGVDGDEAYGLEAPVSLLDGPEDFVPENPGDEGKQTADTPEERNTAVIAPDDKAMLAAIKDWMQTGEVPESLQNAPIEWTDKKTGALRRATIGELKEMGMRQSEFSSKMGQIRQYEQQLQFRDQANNQFWQAIREPAKMLEQFENRGYDEVFEKAAIQYSQKRMQMRRLAEAAGYAVMREHNLPQNHPDVITAVRDAMAAQVRQRKVDIENRILRQHNQMLQTVRQQQDTQQATRERMTQLNNSLAQLIPTAFKAVGVRNRPDNIEAFYKHLNAYVTTLDDWDGNIRRVHVQTAAQMVREELEDMAALRRGKTPPPPQSRALPPGRMGQSGSAAPVHAARKRPSEFEASIAGRG